MEITILDGDGLPAGSILSIKSGTVHCQAALELNKPIYVPCTNRRDLSIGLLKEICRSKLEPAKTNGVSGAAGTNKDDTPDPHVHRVEFKDQESGKLLSHMRIRVGPSTTSSSNSPSKKHGHALSACKYLEEHDIAGVVRNLVAGVLKARPEEPLAWLAKELQDLNNTSNDEQGRKSGHGGKAAAAPANGDGNEETASGATASAAAAGGASSTSQLPADAEDLRQGATNSSSSSATAQAAATSNQVHDAEDITGTTKIIADATNTSTSASSSTGAQNNKKQRVQSAKSFGVGKCDLTAKIEEIERQEKNSHRTSGGGDSGNIGNSENEDLEEGDFLRASYVFRHVPKSTFDRHVRPKFQKMEFRPGHVFWEEGDSVTSDENMYVVEKGRVQVRRDGLLVNVVKAGGFFGERALLCDMPRQARCETVGLQATTVWALDRDTFEDYVKNDPAINKNHSQELFPAYRDSPVQDADEMQELLTNDERYKSCGGLDIPKEKQTLFVMLSKLWVFRHLTGTEMQAVLNAFQFQLVDAYMPMLYRGKDNPIYPKQQPKTNKVVWFEEGEPVSDNEHLYVIETGTVEVFQNQRRINVLRSGDILGELGMVFDLPRQCTCVVQEPTAKFWSLKREDFDTLIRGNDKFSQGEHSSTFFRMYPAPRPSRTGGSADLLYGNDDTSEDDAFAAAGKSIKMTDQSLFDEERRQLRNLLKRLWVFQHLEKDAFRDLLFRFEKEEIKATAAPSSSFTPAQLEQLAQKQQDGDNKNNSASLASNSGATSSGSGSGNKQYILKEGDSSAVNDYMYVIESGTVAVEIDDKVVRSLSAGDMFGELAFVYDLPRQASCYPSSSVVKVWKLSRDAFDELIGSNDSLIQKHSSIYYRIYQQRKIADLEIEEERAYLAQMLKDHSWCFKYLAEDDLKALVRTLQRVEVVAPTSEVETHTATTIVEEGDSLGQDAGLYLIEAGVFECLQGEELVNTLRKGDIFGELGMVFGLTRQATVKLATPAAGNSSGSSSTIGGGLLWKIDYDAFDKFLGNNPDVNSKPEFFRNPYHKAAAGSSSSTANGTTSMNNVVDNNITDLARGAGASTEEQVAGGPRAAHEAPTLLQSNDPDVVDDLSAKGGAKKMISDEDDADGITGSSSAAMGVGKTVSERASKLRLKMMLQRTWVFRHLSDADRAELATRFQRVKKATQPGMNMRLLEEGEGAELLVNDGVAPGSAGGLNADRGKEQESLLKDTDCMYLIESGEVKVERKGHVVARLQEGDFFGELSLIYGTPRQATCYLTSETAVLWALERGDFQELVAGNAALLANHSSEYYRTYDNPHVDVSESVTAWNMNGEERFLSRVKKLVTTPPMSDEEARGLFSTVKEEVHAVCGTEIAVRKSELCYVESGQAMLFDGHQLVSMKVAGEFLFEELLESDSFYSVEDLRAETAQNDTRLWRFSMTMPGGKVANADFHATSEKTATSAVVATGSHQAGTAADGSSDHAGMLKVASQSVLNSIYEKL
ncbi:unnamed protein product [Amoebophrya sp. A120]|nr:unnamed protein product [Amoebophrya sp. A120]|eukprot:GSA120T00019073001.1